MFSNLCLSLGAASPVFSSSYRSAQCVSSTRISSHTNHHSAPNTNVTNQPPDRNHALVHSLEKGLDWASIISGAIGAAGLILLSIFDTVRHPPLHSIFLLVFMLGIVLSALFTTLEYRRLGKAFIERIFLKLSYRFKQAVVVLEVCLSVAFGAATISGASDPGAILEWRKPPESTTRNRAV